MIVRLKHGRVEVSLQREKGPISFLQSRGGNIGARSLHHGSFEKEGGVVHEASDFILRHSIERRHTMTLIPPKSCSPVVTLRRIEMGSHPCPSLWFKSVKPFVRPRVGKHRAS